MSSFFFGLFFTLIIFFYALLCESASMALLGMTLAAFLGYSFFSLMLRRRGMDAALEAPISIAEKDRKFSLRVTVHNAANSGLGRAKVRIGYKNVMSRKYRHVTLTAQEVPVGDSGYQYELLISEAGSYEFRLEALLFYDKLGIFHLKKVCKGAVYICVFPEIREIPVSIGERVRNFYGDSDVYDELRPGYDPGEIFGVREFHDGDRLSSVLWKLSAKTEELMVRENSLPKACPVRLFLYAYGDSSDRMLEDIAGMAFSLMDARCAFYAVWMSRSQQEILRARVDDEESFYLFLVTYMQDCSEESTGDLEKMYRDKYRGEYGLHSITFRDGKIFQNGQELEGQAAEEIVLN